MSKSILLQAAKAKPKDDPKDKAIRLSAGAGLEWADLEVEAADGEPKTPTFKMTAYTGGVMQTAAFYQPVVIDLGGVSTPNKEIPIFRDHDRNKIVGHGTPVVGAKDITAEGVVSAENEHSRDVVASSRKGFPWQASIGLSVHEWDHVKKGEKTTVNGKSVAGPVVVVRKGVLNEISFVPLGADGKTKSKVSATRKDDAVEKDFLKWLEARSIEKDEYEELPEGVQKTLKASFDAEVAAAEEDLEADDRRNDRGMSDEFDSIIKARKDERGRVQKITRLVAEAVEEHPMRVDEIERLGKQAIKAKASPQEFELELLRSLRPIGPSNVRAAIDDGGLNAETIEAAVCLQLRIGEPDKHFSDKTLSAAHQHFRHGIGLKEMLLIAARQNGYRGHAAGDVRHLLECAFPPRQMQASFSTYSVSGILGNVMNKMLVDHFNHVENVWRDVSAFRTVSDFKQITSYSLTGDLEYQKIGPSGEIKHGTLGETSYSNKADTFARMLAITRQDIINDDLGALEQVPRKLGRGAGLKINEVFWTAFLDNASFFSSGNNNVSTGMGSALGSSDGAAINAAEVVFKKQTDPDGKPVGAMARIILVPPTLHNTAARWMGGQLIVSGADSTLPNENVYRGRYRVVSSLYMEDTNLTGNSAAAWYLLADPRDLPVIETCFLNGRDLPTVESADADFNTLGIQVRAFHDFGVTKQEFRGGVRSAGS